MLIAEYQVIPKILEGAVFRVRPFLFVTRRMSAGICRYFKLMQHRHGQKGACYGYCTFKYLGYIFKRWLIRVTILLLLFKWRLLTRLPYRGE